MCNLFFKLFTVYRSKPEQTTDCQLSVTTSSSDSPPSYLSDLPIVYTPSRQLRSSTDTRTLRIPRMIKLKSLANSLSLTPVTVLQSNGILSLLTSFTFKTALIQNSPLQTIPITTTIDFKLCLLFFLLHSLSLTSTCIHVNCQYVCMCVVYKKYIII